MNTQLKVTKIGNSAGVVLSKELLAHLDVAVGATLSVSKTPDGIHLSARDPDVQISIAREVMSRRKRALRELAATDEEIAQQIELAEAIMRKDRDLLRELGK